MCSPCSPCLCIWNMRSNSISIRSFCIPSPFTCSSSFGTPFGGTWHWRGGSNEIKLSRKTECRSAPAIHPHGMEWANSVGCVTVHRTTWHTSRRINSWWRRRWAEQIYIYLFRCFAELPKSFRVCLPTERCITLMMVLLWHKRVLNERMPRSDKWRQLV